MSKLSHQAKVYTMLKEAEGNPVSVEQLLSIEGLLPYKLSAYVLYAKIDFGAVIVPVRDGRKVTAYQMTDPGAGLPTKQPKTAVVAKSAKAVKPAKTVKAVKQTKAKAKTVAPVTAVVATPQVEQEETSLKNDKIVDILDEMDTDVASFEDRQFASEYVQSL